MLRPSKILGFTLTELLVALTLNIFLFAGLITIFVSNINHYRRTLDINRLNQQLQSLLMFMSDDIRRAGYWANARSDIGTNQNNNPFMASGTDISVNGSGDCILLTYDRDSNGSLPSINASIDDERYGYRLMNQAIQARPPGATFACNASASNWENMTDTKAIEITALSFVINSSTVTTGPGTRGLMIRSVDITITGRLADDHAVSKTVTQHVKVRNDKFIP